MSAITNIDKEAVVLFAPDARMAATDGRGLNSELKSFSEALRSSKGNFEISDLKHKVRERQAVQEVALTEGHSEARSIAQDSASSEPKALSLYQSSAEALVSPMERPAQRMAAHRQGLPVTGKGAPQILASMIGSNLQTESSHLAISRESSASQIQTSAAALVPGLLPAKGLGLMEIDGQPLIPRSVAESLNSSSFNLAGSGQARIRENNANVPRAERLGETQHFPSGLNSNAVTRTAELGVNTAQQMQSLSLEQTTINPTMQSVLRGVQVIEREALGLNERSKSLRVPMVPDRLAMANADHGLNGLLSRSASMDESLRPTSFMRGPAVSGGSMNSSASPMTLVQPFLNPAVSFLGQEAGLLSTTMRLPSGLELANGSAQGQLLSSVHHPVWAQELAQQAKFMIRDALKFAELKLTPANLGTVEVMVKQEDQQTTLMFFAKNPVAREALEASLQRLQKSFEDDGLNLEGTFVSDQSLSEHRQQAAEDGLENPSGFGRYSDSEALNAGPASKIVLSVGSGDSERLLDAWA